jgi:hypothetical protein
MTNIELYFNMNEQRISTNQLKILLALQHISEDAQQWKENKKTDLDDDTNVDKQWNNWTGFKTRFLRNWEELDSPGNAFSELLKLNKRKFTTGKKQLSIIKYTEQFKELIRKAGITDGNTIYQYSLGLTTNKYRSIALTNPTTLQGWYDAAQRQPRIVVPMPVPTIQATTTKWPRSEAAINGNRANTSAHPCIAPVAPHPPKSSPDQRVQTALIHPPNKKRAQPPVGMMLIQTQTSIFPGQVEEERCTAYVADKINKTKKMQCSPEPPMALSPSSPPSAPPMQTPIPPYESDEPARESKPRQQTYDISQGEKIANEHSPGGLVAETLSIPSTTYKAQSLPAISTQMMPVHQLPDKLPLSVEMAPKRRDLSIISSRQPMSSIHSPTIEAA